MESFDDIALFVQVARHGSFSEVGRRLGMPPNTVSRRIQALEERLGARLMQRTTRKLVLTAAGQAFYTRCQAAVADLEQATRDLSDGSGTASGTVRVGVVTGFFEFFPIARIRAFLQAHPRVQLDFQLSSEGADVITAEIDVAFRVGAVRGSGHVVRYAAVPPSDFVASPDYVAERGLPRDLDDLANHDCLVLRQRDGQKIWRLRDRSGRIHEIAVPARMVANFIRPLQQAALGGLGIALLPNLPTVIEHIASGRLVRVLPDYRSIEERFTVVYPSRHQRPPAVTAFVQAVVSWVQHEMPKGI